MCSLLYNLMEDVATAEISRAQFWHRCYFATSDNVPYGNRYVD
ncbi:hypothetical protein [Tumebacillus permanentifrigoris]